MNEVIQNLPSWMLQTLVVASIGAALPKILRLQHPRTQVLDVHALLLVCLLLPVLQPWRHPPVARVAANPGVMNSGVAMRGGQPAHRSLWPLRPAVAPAVPSPRPSRNRIVLLFWIFAGGVAARLCWMLAGLWRIRKYRIGSTPVYPLPEPMKAASALTHADALICASSEISSPLTLGWLAPVVLVPDSTLALSEEALCGVICHELLHVARHDWMITIFEELAGALLWFNPAAWWLLAQTRLAREQLVDSEVVRLTADRESYIDSLLSIARTGSMLDLAPAPLFLRKRHLTQRLHLLKEVSMSHTRLLSSYGSMAAIVASAAWLACTSFPLAGQPQQAAPSPATVTVTVPNRWQSFGTLDGNHYRHKLTGVEFDVPERWSLGTDVPNDTTPISMTMLNDPEARVGRAGVQMLPIDTPGADIPAALDHAIPQIIGRRARVGILNFHIREGSEEHTWINGNQALRAVAESDFHGRKRVEFRTWIYTEHTRTDFYFIFFTTTGDEDALRGIFDQWVQSARIP